jgi:hypothetical protein
MYQPGVKRIAVCFSGQPRTWKKCTNTWNSILQHHGQATQIDVFCHLWDFNTVSNATEFKGNQSVKVPQEEIDELITFLKPKKVLIESEKTLEPMDPTQAITVPSWLSQFYGINRASRLKKEFEVENDLMYDLVVRARYDTVYQSQVSEIYPFIKPNTMHGFHFGWDTATKRGRMGDICWVADSITYDLIADYFLNLGKIDKKWFGEHVVPEQVFYHYIKKNNIDILCHPWMIQLMRFSQELSYTKTKDGYETW